MVKNTPSHRILGVNACCLPQPSRWFRSLLSLSFKVQPWACFGRTIKKAMLYVGMRMVAISRLDLAFWNNRMDFGWQSAKFSFSQFTDLWPFSALTFLRLKSEWTDRHDIRSTKCFITTWMNLTTCIGCCWWWCPVRPRGLRFVFFVCLSFSPRFNWIPRSHFYSSARSIFLQAFSSKL